MSDGYCVETECVAEAATGLSDLTSDLDEVTSYVGDADPEWWMWGTVGVPFSQPYQECADRVREILALLSPAVLGLSNRIGACAEDYDETERSTCEDFDRLGSELSGGVHV